MSVVAGGGGESGEGLARYAPPSCREPVSNTVDWSPNSETPSQPELARSFPPDILGDIFVLAIPSGESHDVGVAASALRISRVCGYWRRVCKTTARLWTHISSTFDPNFVRTSIAMSNKAPLHVRINMHNFALASLLLEESSRFQSLVLFAEGSQPTGNHEAPMLKQLVVNFGVASEAGDGPLYSWSMPRLQKIDFTHAVIPKLNNCFTPSVSHLYLCHTTYGHVTDVFDVFFAVCDQLPRLKVLRLEHSIPPLRHDIHGYSRAKGPVSWPFLTSLELYDIPKSCNAFLCAIAVPQVSHVSLSLTYAPEYEVERLANTVKTLLFRPDGPNTVHSLSFDSRRIEIWNQPVRLEAEHPSSETPTLLDVLFTYHNFATMVMFAERLSPSSAKALRLDPAAFDPGNVYNYYRLPDILPDIEHLVVGQMAWNCSPSILEQLLPGPVPWILTYNGWSQDAFIQSTFTGLSTLTLIDFDRLLNRDALETIPSVLESRVRIGRPIEHLVLRRGDLFVKSDTEKWLEAGYVKSVDWDGSTTTRF